MSHQKIIRLVLLANLALASLVRSDDGRIGTAPPNYNDHIKPIVRQHCLKCHGDDKQKADINLQIYASLLRMPAWD